MDKIGLFPLNLVMFPNSSMPLHIFEPRYKQLVGASLAEHKPFGINLVDSSKLYQTGCTVEVSEVTKTYPDGRMDIVITGKQRYTLSGLREGEELYYVGMIELFDDVDDDVDSALRYECIKLHNEVIEIAFPLAIEEYQLSELDSDTTISFSIAQKAGLNVLRKQELLELRSENQRLKVLKEYMEGLLPDLRQKHRIQQVIMSDGYLPRNFSQR
jgi:ATP-dependent Lon protease